MPDLRDDQHPGMWAVLFGDDQALRITAVEALGKVDVEWPVSWLSLLLADSNPKVAQAAYGALKSRGNSLIPLLSSQRLSPLHKVRLGAVRLMGECGEIEDVSDALSALFDPVVDVRDEAKKSIEAILRRTLDRPNRFEDGEAIEQTMQLFASLAGVPHRNVRGVIVSSLIQLSNRNRDLFWGLFESLEAPSQGAVEHEILTRPNLDRIELLYQGLASKNERVAEKSATLIERLLNKDGVSDHINSLNALSPKRRERAMEVLSRKGLITSFFEYLPWVKREPKIQFLRSLQYEIGEVYFAQHLALLNDANPQLMPTLMENFLTFQKAIPSDQIKRLVGHPSQVVVRSILQYLYYRGGQDIVPTLLPLLQSEDQQTVRQAARSISRISRDYLVNNFSRLPTRERNALTRILQRIDDGFINSLVDTLSGLDDEDRVSMALILAELSDQPEALKGIEDLLEDSDERIRAAAVRALEKIRPEDLEEMEIERLFSDSDGRVRANLIESLPLEAKHQWRAKIEEASRSNFPRERANAIRAMFEMGQNEAEIALMQMLRHPESWMRTSGLWVLSQVDAPHLMQKALDLCDDPTQHVRLHAIRAIGKKGDDTMAQKLTAYLSDPSAEVRDAVSQVVYSKLRSTPRR